ncbi:hypothetical protein BRADI_3g15077v3 [Brachypodium distachyon]|uniref:Uncharacterized protein n=1 Tax=Brachypodium distachyon TaxID=15368 RepID=A0A2K2CX91_BRADI|nr:hypothetical protein BRADI_3g15077v3 [Brachypodium distachyon]
MVGFGDTRLGAGALFIHQSLWTQHKPDSFEVALAGSEEAHAGLISILNGGGRGLCRESASYSIQRFPPGLAP